MKKSYPFHLLPGLVMAFFLQGCCGYVQSVHRQAFDVVPLEELALPHAYLEVEPYLGTQELAWRGIPLREERYGQWYRFSLKIAGHRFKGLSLARMTIYDGAAPVDWLDWLSAREWKRPGLQQYGLDIGAFELPWKKLVAEVVVEAVYDDGKEETLVRRYDLLPRPEASRQCVFP